MGQLVVLAEVRKLFGRIVCNTESKGLTTHVFGPMSDVHREDLHGAIHFVISFLPSEHRRASWVCSHGVVVLALPLFHNIHFAAPRDKRCCLILSVTS